MRGRTYTITQCVNQVWVGLESFDPWTWTYVHAKGIVVHHDNGMILSSSVYEKDDTLLYDGLLHGFEIFVCVYICNDIFVGSIQFEGACGQWTHF